MDNQYDLDQLRRSKEDLEQLVAQHFKSNNRQTLLPKKLEDEFWAFNMVVFKKLCHFLKLLKTGMMHYGNYI